MLEPLLLPRMQAPPARRLSPLLHGGGGPAPPGFVPGGPGDFGAPPRHLSGANLNARKHFQRLERASPLLAEATAFPRSAGASAGRTA